MGRAPAGALAGISGVWAAFLLGCSMGGRRAGFWSAVILQSSLLYFALARMLTPDIIVTQFIAWAMYFFWRSWWKSKRKAESGRRKIFCVASGRLDCHRAWFFDERADRPGHSVGCIRGAADFSPKRNFPWRIVFAGRSPGSRCFCFWPHRGFWRFFRTCRNRRIT